MSGCIKKLIVELFWPWFKQVAWAAIKKQAKEIIFFVLRGLGERIKKWITTRSEQNAEDANQKAEDCEKKAKSAGTGVDIEKYEALAKVWREVAEKFRQENEILKEKIEDFTQEVKQEASEKVDDLDIDLDISDEKPVLLIGNASYELPTNYEKKIL